MIAPQEPAVADRARALLALAEELAAEMRPGLRRGALSLDSSLADDMGIDSLARVELLLRIERAFRTTLPERAAAAAETLRDLLRALESARPGGEGAAEALPPSAGPLERVAETPEEARTLVEVLEWRVRRHGERPHITLIGEGDAAQSISYAELWREAGEVAAGLRDRGIEAGVPVTLMLQTCREYFSSFFGVLLAGGIPAPLYPPAKATQIEEHVRRQAGILNNARAAMMIVSEEAKGPAGLVKSLAPRLRHVVTPSEVRAAGAAFERLAAKPGDTAMLQYTSGSTGDPKGVTLSHANLLANLRMMTQACGINSTDVFVSWLPLYHDMGLIGAWFGSLYTGARAVLMSPLLFLSRPQRWLRAMTRERGTVSAAPNFAYDLCANKLPDRDVDGLDLSPWRLAFNGAEAVHADTLEKFAARFARVGFRREALMPVYGLAENCLGVTFPPPGRGPVVDRVRREDFMKRGKATPAETDDATALAFVGCGRPLPGLEVRIVDEAGRECGDREHGRLQFRGPSATGGYYRNPEATRRLFSGDWVDSGDLAYVAGGEVFPAGRAKDLIIKGGRNILPTEIEELVSGVHGVRRGCVAVFGAHDPRSGTERIVIVAETAQTGDAERADLRRRISEAAAGILEGPPEEIVLAPPRSVPKTPSGKIRRSAARAMHERGDFGRPPPGAAVQLVRLLLTGVAPELRRAARAAARSLYALWAWSLFALILLPVWLTVVPGPTLRLRRRTVRLWMRVFLRLIGVRVSVTGLTHLPAGPCVLAPNHASYLDSLVLAAALPPDYGFVAKRELSRNPFLSPLLRRLGAVFVERFDPEQSVQDTEGVAAVAKAGRSLVIFPEGTFRRAPGLQPFRMGAFVVAAQLGLPLVPIGIRGTRSVLRDKTWVPRPGPVGVIVAEPLRPDGGDWAAAIRLRDAARREIAARCGEGEVVGGR